jgi:hypothetical protein
LRADQIVQAIEGLALGESLLLLLLLLLLL